MIRNYLKSALRNLVRQQAMTIINILCLGVAVGCSIIAYLFAYNNLNSEWFHTKGDRIFLIEHRAVRDGDVVTIGSTPTPLGPAIATDHPSIVNCVRIDYGSGIIKTGADKFEETIRFVDPAFLDMFTFPLKYGDRKALYQKNSVVISEETAQKYFGDENPLGRALPIAIAGRDEQLFIVKGVAEKFIGPSSCVAFSILAPYENLFSDNQDIRNDWNEFTVATFIEIDDARNLGQIASQMGGYASLHAQADRAGAPIKAFVFENLYDLKTGSAKVQDSISGRAKWAPMIVLATISLFLLLLSCCNFINISLAMAANRLKEIGIRKVIGGNRHQLMIQFMTENLLVCIGSFVFAMILTQSLLLPGFEQIAGTGITLDFGQRPDLWIYLLLLLTGVAAASGLYPAYYISSFRPIAILRDKLQFGTNSRFMQSLLTIQFALALITMMSSVGLVLNTVEMRDRDWGYNPQDILTVQVQSSEQYNLLRKTANEMPFVKNLTGARMHVGDYRHTKTIGVNENRTSGIVFEVGKDYFSTMGFRLVSGSLPETSNVVLVNEKLAGQFHDTNIIGQAVVIDSIVYHVSGVVADFHYSGFNDPIEPVVFRLGTEGQFFTFVVKAEPTKAVAARNKLEAIWKRNYPETPFTAYYQAEVFEEMYSETGGIVRIFIFTTIVALFMSCVGLFGLASQRLQFKMKELCIRKIFGVPVLRAVFLVNGNFLALLGLAILIATPASYFILNALLDAIYTYRMEVSITPFILAYALMFVTIVITLSGKIYQIVVTNPAEILRNE